LVALNVRDFLKFQAKPREMLLGPILPTQSQTMLFGPRGVGKTHVALGIAVAVTGGGKFLKWEAPKARKVLYVDGELPSGLLQVWVSEALLSSGLDEAALELVSENLVIINPDLQEFGIGDLATARGQRQIEEHVSGADLVVLDNLSALVQSGVENEAESWAPVQRWALNLRRQGKSVLFLHHAGRNGQARGTSKREDLLDTIIGLEHPSGYTPDQGCGRRCISAKPAISVVLTPTPSTCV
jgi:putative DNA primase/helicase